MTYEKPTVSPWGTPVTCREIYPGVWTIKTASHGGIWVDNAAVLARIPLHRRAYAARRSRGHGEHWYEEDFAAGAVMLAIPGAFSPADVETARALAPSTFDRHEHTRAGEYHTASGLHVVLYADGRRTINGTMYPRSSLSDDNLAACTVRIPSFGEIGGQA
jgi:hypothetical protein